jgi:hypothetical protein
MGTYNAPWGATLKWASALATGLLVVGAGTSFSKEGWLGALLLAIPAGALPFVVRGYTIRDGALLIRRLWWNTRIDLKGLRSVRFEPEALRGSIRTWGNGGLYSFTGWYWSRRLGRYRAFATDLKKPVVLTFDKYCVIVTPEEPDAFVKELSAW